MDSLAHVLTAGWASGVNAYATVLVIGLLGRYGDVEGVPDALERTEVLLAAAALFAIEFVADKIPYLDTAWDALHTAIRPTMGAILAALVAGEADDLGEGIAAVLGGSTALATHLTKASLRLAVNASPEPFSNIFLSLAEDISVVGVLLLAVESPWWALALALALLATGAVVAGLTLRTVRRAWPSLLGRTDVGPPRHGRT